MMSEPKGRGGKKPKYQIADIGGADLTSEDISTERVLNFLIKGEMASTEQSGSAVPGGTEGEQTALPATQSTPPSLPERSVQSDIDSSERPVKKSLSHLFERAGSGSSSPAKDLKLKLSEPKPVPFPPAQEQAIANKDVIETEGADAKPPLEATSALQEQPVEAPIIASPKTLSQPVTDSPVEPTLTEPQSTEQLPVKPIEPSSELAHYVELWKNFYRLNSGEIDALSTLYRMSHDQGRSECFVKMRKLAEISGLDYRYCQKVVRSLEALGWITKLQDYDPVTKLGVLYRVNLNPSQML